MTIVQQRREALTGSACPENAAQPVELLYVHHPEVSRAPSARSSPTLMPSVVGT